MAEGGPPEFEAQKNEIGQHLKAQLKKGDAWYLVDAKWFKQWKRYVGYDSWDSYNSGEQSAFPGPIDNGPLLSEDGKTLKDHLVDELDYVLVIEAAWKKLVAWYGTVEGQEPIARKVIEQGMFVKHCKVEVYLVDLKLCKNEEVDTFETRQFSRADTIDEVEKEMRKLFSIDEKKEVRLWNKYMTNTYEHLSKGSNTVQDAGLYSGQVIVIEQKNEDGSWPRQKSAASSYSTATSMSPTNESTSFFSTNTPTKSSSTSSYTNSYLSSSYSTSTRSGSSSYGYHHESANPGLCGLSNLGNTCFMNSALQCMSNVPKLTKYFLSDVWQDELNEDNPLGMKGEIAKSYAALIHTMWSGQYSYTVPRDFKIAVGRFAPQFSGYQQQDSQELMAFLLDGLHEDLNRIRKKPYVELQDANGRPDKVVAKESWDNYRKRNDSIIVDTFHGLLKSTLVCPECSKVSVTFDPFCYLSLPLPYKKERQLEVFLVPLDPESKTTQYKLTVPKMGTVGDLCVALSKYTNIEPDKMVVTDVYNHRFHKVFSRDEGLNHITDRDDIFVYEVPVNCGDDPNTLVLPVYLREEKRRTGNQYSSTQLFGQPLLVPVPRKNCTCEDLYKSILHRMSRYVKEPDEDSDWWKIEEEMQRNGEVEMNSEGSDTEDHNKENEESSSMEEEHNNEIIKKHRLFKMCIVNSYGSSDVHPIKDDDKPIKLTNRSYVAIDWLTAAKDRFYDEKASEDLDVHSSVNQRIVMQKKQPIQLNECLELFTTKETLGEDDPWYCPTCKKHQQATKKFDLWQLPEVLVIHLKRFSYNRYWRDKLDTFVEYPTRNLNMKKYIINKDHCSTVYDLIAVSNHYGGMGGGHYTAYAKNCKDTDWYHFDDSSVSQATEDGCVTRAGYVLVYQRRGSETSDYNNYKIRTDIPAAVGVPDSNGSTNGITEEDESDAMEVSSDASH